MRDNNQRDGVCKGLPRPGVRLGNRYKVKRTRDNKNDHLYLFPCTFSLPVSQFPPHYHGVLTVVIISLSFPEGPETGSSIQPYGWRIGRPDLQLTPQSPSLRCLQESLFEEHGRDPAPARFGGDSEVGDVKFVLDQPCHNKPHDRPLGTRGAPGRIGPYVPH